MVQDHFRSWYINECNPCGDGILPLILPNSIDLGSQILVWNNQKNTPTWSAFDNVGDWCGKVSENIRANRPVTSYLGCL